MKSILSYTPGDSVIHRMNPIMKLILAFCICIAAFITDSIPYLLFILVCNLMIGVIGTIPGKAFRLLINLCKVGLLLFVLQILFVRSGNTLFLFITDEGVIKALTVVLRLINACMPLALVLNLTQITDLSNALVSVTHIPYQYAFTTTTAIHFIPVFFEEMNGIMEAQAARGVEIDTKNFFKKMKLILPLCMPLLLSAVRKIDSTATAAEVRGFELRTAKSGYKKYGFTAIDFVTLLICAALIAIAILLPSLIALIAG